MTGLVVIKSFFGIASTMINTHVTKMQPDGSFKTFYPTDAYLILKLGELFNYKNN